MPESENIHENIESLTQDAIYNIFIEWVATPKILRSEEMQNIADFAKYYQVADRTLYNWKKREGFWDEVEKSYNKASKQRLSGIREALYEKAKVDKDVAALKLYLQYEEKWSEKIKNEVEGSLSLTDLHKAIKKVDNDKGTEGS